MAPEMEIMKRTPWSRIREQNSVYKEFLEIVGNGSPTGSVLKETIAVSAIMSISVEKLHSHILRILSCSRMSEKNREPEVPEERVPVVECLDGLARITSEELAITHFVKGATLQNACSTRPRVVVGLGKSARMHTVRLMNSRLKRSKKNDDKSAVAMLKKGDWHENVREPVINYVKGHDRSGRPDEKRDYELKRGPTKRRSSNARQLGCVFQDMTPPKSILRKSTNMQRPIQRVKFTKAIARHEAAGASHDSPRAQTCTFQGPGLQKHHQNSTKGPPREGEKNENCGGRGKKERNFGMSSGGGSSGGFRVLDLGL